MESTVTASGQASAERHVVCGREDLSPGEMREFTVGKRRLAVMRLGDGSYRATSNTCPHEGARLSGGKVEKMWTADEIGQYRCSERTVIVCPWHNFEFDVDTGRAYAPGRLRVKVYRTSLENGDLVVYM